MARPITSLDHFDRDNATPEEREAYRVTHEVLHQRLNRLLQQADCAKRMSTPVTDAYGRPLRQQSFG
jgi:hypothetical protein